MVLLFILINGLLITGCKVQSHTNRTFVGSDQRSSSDLERTGSSNNNDKQPAGPISGGEGPGSVSDPGKVPDGDLPGPGKLPGDDTKDPIDPIDGGETCPDTDNPNDFAAAVQANVMEDLKFFANVGKSDASGRSTGTEGHENSAQHFEDSFKELGIQPATGGSYRQNFQVNRTSTFNTVGLLEGSDPALKDQIIVLGAHLDSLKRSADFYPGADDNASGSSALLQVAKQLANCRQKVKRTLVFIAFSGEEQGLVGSRYFVNNPMIDLDKVVLMINMDMIGYSKGKISILGGSATKEVESRMDFVIQDYDLQAYLTKETGGRSDHYHFENAGIPAIFFNTGTHNNYHNPTDTPERIDAVGMGVVTALIIDTTIKFASDETFRAMKNMSLWSLNKSYYGVTSFENDIGPHGDHEHGASCGSSIDLLQ